jgi:hypothetical protein
MNRRVLDDPSGKCRTWVNTSLQKWEKLMPTGRRITARGCIGSSHAVARACLDNYPFRGPGRMDSIFNEQTRIGVLAAYLREIFQIASPSEVRGRRECRVRAAPEVPCAICKRMRTRAYRAAESIRHSLRDGFTTYSALSLVIGFLATIAPEKLASQVLDASTEASGPHAFVVRVSAPRQRRLRVHRNPPLVRDDGQRPSSRDGMASNMPSI